MVTDRYKINSFKLDNGIVVNRISVSWMYCTFDVRTKVEMTLDAILEIIYNKYGCEIDYLNPVCIIELD